MIDDDKVDLNLIAALIRHIVLEEEVSFLCFCSKNIILILYIKAMKKIINCFLKIAYGKISLLTPEIISKYQKI